VRNDFAESQESWPAHARILFAWARPCPQKLTTPIPCQEHEAALRHALAPWIPLDGVTGAPPDISGVLRVLPNATLQSLRATCQEAVDQKKPFTHVHLLGHGYPVGDLPGQVFGIALEGEDLDCNNIVAATPEQIAEALTPLRGQAVVLSLAVCDAANDANMIMPDRSIAHELHLCGFPVVIASQLPLTVPGSTVLVETFYRELLAGNDVRVALHRARCALFENTKVAGHDWASLTGYVRLPEGYCDHLPAVRLEAVLTSLKAVQGWSDDLIKSNAADASKFNFLIGLLGTNIERLKTFLEPANTMPKGVLEENLGLLGSAEKRVAELYFECGARSGADGSVKAMRAALQRARSWYRQGFESNLSHHWTGVQQLSLQAVLDGKLNEPDYWYSAVLAAKLDSENPKVENQIWAWGSLAELYLLAPAVGMGDQTEKGLAAIQEMKSRVQSSANGNRFPLESTLRQFRRYMHWWTTEKGFFAGQPDLSAQAARLAEAIEKSDLPATQQTVVTSKAAKV
jgi:hypothetical protein